MNKNTLNKLYALRAGIVSLGKASKDIDALQRDIEDCQQSISISRSSYEEGEKIYKNNLDQQEHYQNLINDYESKQNHKKINWKAIGFQLLIAFGLSLFIGLIVLAVDKSWVTFLITFLCGGVGLFLLIGFIAFLSHSSDKKQSKKDYENIKNNLIVKLNKSNDDYAKHREELKISVNQYQKDMESLILNKEKQIDNIKNIATCLLTVLKDNYQSLLDPRDWEHIDLIIYNCETGRARDIREALILVDQQISLNNIQQILEQSQHAIIDALNHMSDEIDLQINELNTSFCYELEKQHIIDENLQCEIDDAIATQEMNRYLGPGYANGSKDIIDIIYNQ